MPGLLLALCALGLAAWRMYVVGVRAALDLQPFREALEARWAAGDSAGARVLCRGLPEVWAAEGGLALLDDAAELPTRDELLASYRYRAEVGLFALFTLSRMALPLALASAIFVLSRAFTAQDPHAAEGALHAAVECIVTGLLTMLFCRTSLGLLQRQVRQRMHEVGVVANVLRM